MTHPHWGRIHFLNICLSSSKFRRALTPRPDRAWRNSSISVILRARMECTLRNEGNALECHLGRISICIPSYHFPPYLHAILAPLDSLWGYRLHKTQGTQRLTPRSWKTKLFSKQVDKPHSGSVPILRNPHHHEIHPFPVTVKTFASQSWNRKHNWSITQLPENEKLVLVISNGLKCKDDNFEWNQELQEQNVNQKTTTSTTTTTTDALTRGQLTENTNHQWHGNRLQSVQENNLVTPNMPETHRMDKLFWHLCEALTGHVDWAWALHHPSLATVSFTSGSRSGILRRHPGEQRWCSSGSPGYQLGSSWLNSEMVLLVAGSPGIPCGWTCKGRGWSRSTGRPWGHPSEA